MGSVAEESCSSQQVGPGIASGGSQSQCDVCYLPITSFEELMNYGEGGEGDIHSVAVKEVCKSRTVPLLDKSFGKGKISFVGKSPVVATGEDESDGKQPLTLVCHDLKGGYGDDRFVDGTRNLENYTYRHWLLTDIFCYFSHKFVTIPPLGWINAAHSHGVKILGTIITEWDEGHDLCTKILESEESIDKTVQKLCKINEDYGFEGYLLNIENKLDGEEQTQKMVEFTRKLTEELKKQSPKNMIIWYDSVTKNGELKWQDELNEKNRIFFDVCDGIYLNYNWNEEKLRNSINLAGENRRYDVFCGIDCWGRGCWGGGGMNTCLAVEKVAAHKMSIAFFAPGWTYESHDFKQYPFIDDELWTKCMKNLQTRFLVQSHVPVTSAYKRISGLGGDGAKSKKCDKTSTASTDSKFQILLATDFCRGYGSKYFSFGNLVAETPWFDLSKQSFQPVIFSSVKCLEYDCRDDQTKYANFFSQKKKDDPFPPPSSICVRPEPKIAYDIEKGFFGGGALKIFNSKSRPDFEEPLTSSPVWIPMSIPITASRLTLAAMAIWKSVSVHHQLKLFLELGKEGCPNRKVLLGDLDSLATSVRGKFFISLKLSQFLNGMGKIEDKNDLEFHFQKNNYDEKQLNGWRVSCFLIDIDQVYDEYSSIKSLRAGAVGDISLGFLSLGQIIHYIQ